MEIYRQRDTDRQIDKQTQTDRHRQTYIHIDKDRKTKTDNTQTGRQIQTDRVRQTQTDRRRQKDTNRQNIENFCVFQLQIVCENQDCLQAWLGRFELIWSPVLDSLLKKRRELVREGKETKRVVAMIFSLCTA